MVNFVLNQIIEFYGNIPLWSLKNANFHISKFVIQIMSVKIMIYGVLDMILTTFTEAKKKKNKWKMMFNRKNFSKLKITWKKQKNDNRKI